MTATTYQPASDVRRGELTARAEWRNLTAIRPLMNELVTFLLTQSIAEPPQVGIATRRTVRMFWRAADPGTEARRDTLALVLQQLVAVYAGRPGYDTRWTPRY